MDLITTTAELTSVCARLAKHPVITVDTEFLRETTYYPLLCVVQMASPDEAVVVDGNCITSQGPGTALAFALTLVERLVGRGTRSEVAKAMLV